MEKLFHKIFVAHPRSINESYFEHLWFTLKVAARIAVLPFTLIIHGLIPPLFTYHTSKKIHQLSDEFKAHNKAKKPSQT